MVIDTLMVIGRGNPPWLPSFLSVVALCLSSICDCPQSRSDFHSWQTGMSSAGAFAFSSALPTPSLLDFTPLSGYNGGMNTSPRTEPGIGKGIDLHAHTTASDGSLSPAELVEKAHRLGLAALAVTDHDTLGGLAEAQSAAGRVGLDLVPGVELSVEDERGRFHLLGYGFDLENEALGRTLADLRRSRAARNARMGDRMAALGLPVTMDDVRAEAGEDAEVIARPHFARALMKHGVVASVAEAFDRYLSTGKPLYLPKEVLTPRDAIALLHGAGGVAVMAHPGLVLLDAPALADRVASLAQDAGLDGIEAYYSQHTLEDTDRFLFLAARLGLLVTGGSDFHGLAKPHVPLGVVFGGKPAPPALLDSLRARLASQNPILTPANRR